MAPALARGLEVLEALTRDPYGMTLSELSVQLGIPSASLWRISRVLTEKGYVAFDDHKKTYRLGLKLMTMGNALFSNGHLRTLAREDLKKLAEETGETVELHTRIHDQLFILDHVSGPGEVYLSSRTGTVIQFLHATAPGKIYLAHLDRKNVKAVLDKIGLPKLTRNTIDTKERLEKELEQITVNGYAVDLEEMGEGVSRVAAPVYGREKEIKACVAVVCPAHRLRRKKRKDIFCEMVKSAAAEMTQKYGGKM